MRARKKELDVDFIGGVGSLTKEEEKRISDVIKRLKPKEALTSQKSKQKFPTKKKVTA